MSKSLGRNQDLFLRALASLTSERGPGRCAVPLILQRAFELSDPSREREDSEGPPWPSYSKQWLSLKDLETDLNPSRVLASLTNRGLIDGRNLPSPHSVFTENCAGATQAGSAIHCFDLVYPSGRARLGRHRQPLASSARGLAWVDLKLRNATANAWIDR